MFMFCFVSIVLVRPCILLACLLRYMLILSITLALLSLKPVHVCNVFHVFQQSQVSIRIF